MPWRCAQYPPWPRSVGLGIDNSLAPALDRQPRKQLFLATPPTPNLAVPRLRIHRRSCRVVFPAPLVQPRHRHGREIRIDAATALDSAHDLFGCRKLLRDDLGKLVPRMTLAALARCWERLPEALEERADYITPCGANRTYIFFFT